MLIIETGKTESGNRIIIRPNRSLSRKGMAIFFAGVCVFALGVAARFWFLGAWLVMPFALLEILVLGVSLVMFERSTRFSEVIELNGQALLLTRQEQKKRQEWSFQPYWVQVVLNSDPKTWYPSHLFLRSHGRLVEIGRCLTDEERTHLSATLKNWLAAKADGLPVQDRI